MDFLCIIPARGGSKGIPGKNKKILDGKPLIAYTIEAALLCNFKEIIVSSDDNEILEIAKSYNITALLRSANLASDISPTLPVINEAISKSNNSFDAVVLLQPTSPLRTERHIKEALLIFENDLNADSLVSVVKSPHKFSRNSLMIQNGRYIEPLESGELVLRRQDKETFYGRNGAAIYITRINRVSEFIFGGNILPYEMDKLSSVDIDDMEDWEMAEAFLFFKRNNLK